MKNQAFRGHDHPKPFEVKPDLARATRIRNGRKWKRVSATFRSHKPYCEKCGLAAEHVHHRIDLALGGEPYAWSNLQSLCRSCHEATHASTGGVSAPFGSWPAHAHVSSQKSRTKQPALTAQKGIYV